MPSIFELDTPVLLIDLDRLEHNIESMAAVARAGNKRLRPHIKTHKTPEITRMQLSAGATGITVAKLGEAEVMVEAGFTDIFIANQIVGAQKRERLIRLRDRADVTVGVDSWEVAEPLALAAKAAGQELSVRIELDTGLGRAGTRSLQELLELAHKIQNSPGLVFDGIFTHEGHLYRSTDPQERAAAAHNVAMQIRTATVALREQGTPASTVSVGSTPGAGLLAEESGIDELRPGVYVFNDRTQMRLGVEPSRCAATVLTTVTSVRSDGRIVVDAGTKSLASDKPFADQTCGEIVGHPELTFVGMSEEHGHLQGPTDAGIHVGDKLQIVPNHACTCVNVHDSLTVYRGDRVEDVWRIAARGRIQ